MIAGLSHTLCRRSMQTTWRCCVQKAWCWTFRQKASQRRSQVSIKKLNASKPLTTCRKGSSLSKPKVSDHRWENCNGHLFTGYRATGIKAAGALYRLLFGTWETTLLMCHQFYGNSAKRETKEQSSEVHTVAQLSAKRRGCNKECRTKP